MTPGFFDVFERSESSDLGECNLDPSRESYKKPKQNIAESQRHYEIVNGMSQMLFYISSLGS